VAAGILRLEVDHKMTTVNESKRKRKLLLIVLQDPT
jgi:hypothetical protein